MFRISLIVVLTCLLVGCSGVPTQATEPVATLLTEAPLEPTTVPPEATTERVEATAPAEAGPSSIQEYPVPAGPRYRVQSSAEASCAA